mmetsp:Transcript_19871/g.54820  ORF Transcript_19871/g.54820 Transcript_19871/m.54820 type:complete len:126 (-) Transcript_19871:323-700(-)
MLVGLAVGEVLGEAVGFVVGEAVGVEDGEDVGLEVGDAVGLVVGLDVGEVVGAKVGTTLVVGAIEGAEVWSHWRTQMSTKSRLLRFGKTTLSVGVRRAPVSMTVPCDQVHRFESSADFKFAADIA